MDRAQLYTHAAVLEAVVKRAGRADFTGASSIDPTLLSEMAPLEAHLLREALDAAVTALREQAARQPERPDTTPPHKMPDSRGL